jgi:hypothetical protein
VRGPPIAPGGSAASPARQRPGGGNVPRASFETKEADDDEDESLTAALRTRFEFTKEDTPMLVSEVVSIMSEFDKKKLDLELAARNVFKKKHKKRDEYREKLCYYGLKRVVSDDDN